MVILVMGLPGSGKSYFAERLAKRLRADYMNTDVIRKSRLEKPTYTDEEKIMIYKEVFDAVYDHAYSRKPLVIDGTFYHRKIRDNFLKLATDLNIELKWIEIVAEEPQIKKRLAEKREWSDANFEVYKSIEEKYTPLVEDHLILKSVDGQVKAMVDKALVYILKKY